MTISYYDDYVYTFRVERNFEDQAKEPFADFWGGAMLFYGNGSDDDACVADYNFCIQDEDTNSSAIYAVLNNETQETDHSTFQHYEVDIHDPLWKEKLYRAMIDFHMWCTAQMN